MAELYAEALQNFLHSAEWRENVEVFVGANCLKFKDIEEFSVMHFDLWKNFQDIVESVLEMALANIGGSIDMLEQALDEIADTPARGPRESILKDIIDKLLSYDSFEGFRDMMITAAFYKTQLEAPAHTPQHNHQHQHDHQRTPNRGRQNYAADMDDDTMQEYINELSSMGFPDEMIDMVLAQATQETSFQELVIQITDMMDGGNSSSSKPAMTCTTSSQPQVASAYKSTPQPHSPLKSPAQMRNVMSESEEKDDYSDAYEMNYKRYLTLFSRALQVQANNSDIPTSNGESLGSELESKFLMSQSTLDNFKCGDTNPAVVSLLDWASRMVDLLEDIESCCTETGAEEPEFDMFITERNPHGLLAKYQELEKTRLYIEKDDQSGSMVSVAEMQRMSALNAIAAMGTDDEQALHSLINRYEEVQIDINTLHKKFSSFVSSHAGIRRPNMEELYLYLKEKVLSGVAVDDLADEMHEQVYSLIPANLGMDVLCMLLDMHILEDEQNMLRQRINSVVGGAPESSAPSSAEFLSADANGSSASGGKAAVDTSSLSAPQDTSSLSAASISADAKHYGGGSDVAADAKHAQEEDKNQGHGRARCVAPKDGDNSGNAAYLASLKSKHKNALSNLKGGLQYEKGQKLQELEDRLMRRKLARKKNVKDMPDFDSAEYKAIEKELLAGDQEIEDQIVATKQQFENLEEGMISGFKKKCVMETKAAKAKGGPLSDQDLRDAQRDASGEIIKRYERDQKSLLISLEQERMRQRNKIAAALAAKKNKNNKGQHAVMDAEAEKAIQELEKSFQVQEANALSGPQGNVMYALSSIYTPEDMIADVADTGKLVDDEEDDYFDDDEDEGVESSALKAKRKKTKDWLTNVETAKKKYETAGTLLQCKLRDAQQLSEGPVDLSVDNGTLNDEDGNGAFSDVTSHMLKVISTAYSNHLSDESADIASSPNKARMMNNKGEDKELMDRVKAGILDEFERTRDQYEAALLHGQNTSKQRLLNRKNALKKNRMNGAKDEDGASEWGEGNSEEESKVELAYVTKTSAIFEEMVDSFLDDPIELNIVASSPSKLNPIRTDNHSQSKERATTPPQSRKPLNPIVSPVVSSGAVINPDSGLFVKPKQLAPLPPICASPDKRVAEDAAEEANKAEVLYKRQVYEEKENNLMQGLNNQMLQKKRILEERLQRKREQRIKTAELAKESGVSGRVDVAEEEEQIALADCERLNKAYDSIMKMVKAGKGEVDIADIDEEALMGFLDRIMRGESLSSLPLHHQVLEHGEGSESFVASHSQKDQQNRVEMQNEVKRISSMYNEEKQKLDLMMKIQQARQRQTLQRKLLARKQGGGLGGGAGYPGDDAVSTTGAVTGGFNKQRQDAVASRGMNMSNLVRK